MLGALQAGAAVSGADSLISKLRERSVKVRQHSRSPVENVDVEAKLAAFRHGPAI
jgi:hypothetical protein